MDPNLTTGETLSDGSDMPPMTAPMMQQPGEIAVPLKALAQPDDAEQMNAPAEGDTGTMTVDFTVVRIEGDNAIIKPSAVNGTLLDDESAEMPGANDEQEGADLRQMAEGM